MVWHNDSGISRCPRTTVESTVLQFPAYFELRCSTTLVHMHANARGMNLEADTTQQPM